jgi:hypothetical protein
LFVTARQARVHPATAGHEKRGGRVRLPPKPLGPALEPEAPTGPVATARAEATAALPPACSSSQIGGSCERRAAPRRHGASGGGGVGGRAWIRFTEDTWRSLSGLYRVLVGR